MTRRRMLQVLGVAIAGAFGWQRTVRSEGSETKDKAASPNGRLELSDEQWRTVLDPPAYAVLRDEATERPGSSPLNGEKRAGTFICAGCFLPLFLSEHKYESGTGWPSFFDKIKDAIGERSDYSLLIPRTEYHCSRCEGHQGHVFSDGPKPTGLRYCNNGVALRFVAKDEALPALREKA